MRSPRATRMSLARGRDVSQHGDRAAQLAILARRGIDGRVQRRRAGPRRQQLAGDLAMAAQQRRGEARRASALAGGGMRGALEQQVGDRRRAPTRRRRADPGAPAISPAARWIARGVGQRRAAELPHFEPLDCCDALTTAPPSDAPHGAASSSIARRTAS